MQNITRQQLEKSHLILTVNNIRVTKDNIILGTTTGYYSLKKQYNSYIDWANYLNSIKDKPNVLPSKIVFGYANNRAYAEMLLGDDEDFEKEDYSRYVDNIHKHIDTAFNKSKAQLKPGDNEYDILFQTAIELYDKIKKETRDTQLKHPNIFLYTKQGKLVAHGEDEKKYLDHMFMMLTKLYI